VSAARIPLRFGPPVSQNAGVTKRAGREPTGKAPELAALDWSGRQDLNLRPPGPERVSGSCDGLTLSGTASHPRDTTADVDPANPLSGRRDTRYEAGFVPTVSPRFRSKLVLPEQLLTVRGAAKRLRISRASLYRLCAQNRVAHVRVGNAIRFTPADIAAFVHARHGAS